MRMMCVASGPVSQAGGGGGGGGGNLDSCRGAIMLARACKAASLAADAGFPASEVRSSIASSPRSAKVKGFGVGAAMFEA